MVSRGKFFSWKSTELRVRDTMMYFDVRILFFFIGYHVQPGERGGIHTDAVSNIGIGRDACMSNGDCWVSGRGWHIRNSVD